MVLGAGIIMIDQIEEVILTQDQKREFNLTPIYVSISATNIATVWRHLHSAVYFSPGKYLGVYRLEGKIAGHRYKQLNKTEMDVVEKAVKERDHKGEVIFNLQELTSSRETS